MRPLIAALLFSAALSALAQQAPSRPANLAPIPEPPPPPAGVSLDSALDETITIIPGDRARNFGQAVDKVEEHRVGGRPYMMKVYPRNGPPFYLIDYRGDGKFSRADSFDSGVRAPMWTIHTF